MSLAGWIGLGAAGGLVTGLLVGEPAAVLAPVGKAYVMLLQSVVYPYLISSLLHGLGRLSPGMALKLLKKSWPFYLAAWGGTFGAIYLLGLAFPSSPPPIAVDAALPARSGPDFLQIILPGNIIHDIANNYVPAVVLLSVLFGVAIQGLSGKERMLDMLAMVRAACVKIWNWVVMLAPFAVFAMFATAAGTTDLEEAGGLAIYVGLFLAGCGLLALWAIPWAIASLIPVRYRELISDLHNALTLALVTTMSVVALPFIQQAVEKLAKTNGIEEQDRGEIIETTLAINYPLGQLGNFFVFFFILFMAFYTRTTIAPLEQMVLPLMTLFSCFGSPTSSVNAVDFLGQWMQLPGRPAALYVETMLITRYGQVLLSVMGFAFLTYLMTFSYFGKLRLRLGRLLGILGVAAVCLTAVGLGGHALFSQVLTRPHLTYLDFTMPEKLTRGIEARVYKSRQEFLRETPDAALAPGETPLGRIQRTQTLRVGYGRDMVPFSYRNNKGDLVGLDVACAYDLARALNVKLAFVPVEFHKLKQDVEQGIMDIWIGGVYLLEYRMIWAAYSQPYAQSPMALIVPTEDVDDHLDMDQIKKNPDFTLAIVDNTALHILAHRLFPGIRLVTVPSYNVLPQTPGWDAALWTMEKSQVWASSHPGYTAVRPKDMGAVIIYSFMMHKGSDDMLRFVNHWLAMRKADGFLDRQRFYWVDRAVPGGAVRR